MADLFSSANRRNPYPLYAQLRRVTPVLHAPALNAWLAFDYATVRRVLQDHETFSSRVGPDWLLFNDPPRHTKLRVLLSRAFTPASVAALEPRIRELSEQLIAPHLGAGAMDLAVDYAVPLPMTVIAHMTGVSLDDRSRFLAWSDAILNLSHNVHGDTQVIADYQRTTVEMDQWLAQQIEERRASPSGDLLTRLVQAEVDGVRLTRQEILGFVQLLLVGGQETTTNLINNAILCFLEFPNQAALVRQDPQRLPPAIEEVLRYRAPFQWTPRVTTNATELGGQTIPAGRRVIAFIGSANRDPAQFPHPDRYDIRRHPNHHIAFGHGVHFCLGAPLARLEARIALSGLLALQDLHLASAGPWEPREALHVHGPARLPVRFTPREEAATAS